MEMITTDEVMDKLDMFQVRFGRVDGFRWCEVEIFSADAGTQFTLIEFQYKCHTRNIRTTLEALKHQATNRKIEVIWKTFCTIAHSLMVNALFLEVYIKFCINVYSRSYISGTTNKILDKRKWRANHAI